MLAFIFAIGFRGAVYSDCRAEMILGAYSAGYTTASRRLVNIEDEPPIILKTPCAAEHRLSFRGPFSIQFS